MRDPGFSPAADADLPLEPGERVVAHADGVLLGWQPQTILIWWVPGLIFIALAWIQFRSWIVVTGLTVFCAALFLFYSSDREVRPRSGRKRYLLTDKRLLIGAGGSDGWRSVPLGDIAATHMENGVADIVVMVLSSAATIMLVMRDPGPKGEPRRTRIGPMRNPKVFRAEIDARLARDLTPEQADA